MKHSDFDDTLNWFARHVSNWPTYVSSVHVIHFLRSKSSADQLDGHFDICLSFLVPFNANYFNSCRHTWNIGTQKSKFGCEPKKSIKLRNMGEKYIFNIGRPRLEIKCNPMWDGITHSALKLVQLYQMKWLIVFLNERHFITCPANIKWTILAPNPADEQHFIACPALSNEQFWQLFFQPCTQPHMGDGITHSADEQHFITCPALLREMVDCVFKVSIKWIILTIAHPALHWIPYSSSSLILILRSSLWTPLSLGSFRPFLRFVFFWHFCNFCNSVPILYQHAPPGRCWGGLRP